MALGYEGVIKLGSTYVLGTGTSVPRTRVRMESSSGYGGTKNVLGTTGIGLPHNYDWEQHGGSLNFEITSEIIINELKPWLLDRQTAKTVEFKSRKDNDQLYTSNCFWNNINIDAGGEGSAVTGSVGFISLARSNYTWGDSYINNKKGMGLLPCPGGTGTFPLPLNDISNVSFNKAPVPFWNTSVVVENVGKDFITWTVDFSQEVVNFFGCPGTGGSELVALAPLYLAVGPMTITFTGAYMKMSGSGGFLGDTLSTLDLNIGGNLGLGGVALGLKRLESTTEQDDVQTGDSFVPLNVEYAAYEMVA